ncbi:thioredoxin-like protein [Aspergillus coremiiformis]|uniref:Thioredoxin-like protein n=1 Tax=Aspergillus coremiiformis TaxID=138285 RepID=A0A5N6Z7D6_9EURO|nr:thioredoxin-like protein [Aspergillus coremiiformis]
MELKHILILTVIYIVFRVLKSRTSDPAATMPHGKVVEVDNPVIFKALTSSGPVVVDFFATWCGPCKAVAPVVGKFSETFTSVRFLQVDVDKNPQIAKELSVRAMPTFVLFKDGKPLGQPIVGGNMQALEKAIKELVA